MEWSTEQKESTTRKEKNHLNVKEIRESMTCKNLKYY